MKLKGVSCDYMNAYLMFMQLNWKLLVEMYNCDFTLFFLFD